MPVVSETACFMEYGSETRPLLADGELTFKRAEMKIIRWMCGVKD